MNNHIVALEKNLKALANRRRLAIVRLLLHRKAASVGDIADHLKLSLAATSRHLRQLADAGILETKQESTTINYSVCRDNEIIPVLNLTN